MSMKRYKSNLYYSQYTHVAPGRACRNSVTSSIIQHLFDILPHTLVLVPYHALV